MVKDALPTPKESTIIKLFGEKPGASYVSIGNEVGCSREYIRLVLKKYNLFKPKHYVQPIKICPICHKEFIAYTKKQIYCSRSCSGEASKGRDEVALICNSCGKTFYRERCLLRSKAGLYFCGKQCQGRWLGSHTGRSTTRKGDNMKFSYETAPRSEFPRKGSPPNTIILDLAEQLRNLDSDKVLKVKIDGNRDVARRLGSAIRRKLMGEGKVTAAATRLDKDGNTILYLIILNGSS